MRQVQKTFQNRLSARQDIVVLTLLGAILITGFLVEGLIIPLTAIPVSVSLPSFIGYPLSLLLGLFPFRWEWVYPYGWTIHAIPTGLFFLSLPFSKMVPILVSRKVLFINSMTREK